MADDTRVQFLPGPPGWKVEQRTYGSGQRGYWVHGPDGYKSKRLSGVTTALSAINKPALLPWTAKQQNIHCGNAAWENRKALAKLTTREAFDAMWAEAVGEVVHAEKTKAEAAEIGTAIHVVCEAQTLAWLAESRGGFPEPVPEPATQTIADAVAEWRRWVDENDVVFLAAELGVFSQTHGFCGQVDALALVRGRKVIVDYKTSKAIYPVEYFAQVAAYAHAYQEWYGPHALEGLDGAVILRLPKLPGEGFEARELTQDELDEGWNVFQCAQAIKRAQDKDTARWRKEQGGAE